MATRVRPISPSSAARLALASDEQLVASIRDDDAAAFEALYERHSRELLSFCLYMLGSRADAEEALQVTFASAYRALLADERPVALRAWLFTIARNQCLSILRRRRPTVELSGEAAVVGDPFRELELREEVRNTLAGVRELPERQRDAMVMAELHGLSQAEIGGVLGLRPDQVKALVYQARSNLISERRARDTDCHEIRAELASARGAALLKGRLRRHVRACPDCRTYADGVARNRRGLGALVPFAPWLALKFRALQETLTNAGAEPVTYAGGTTLGGTVAGAALLAGGSIKAIAVKAVAGAALLGLSTGLGAPLMSAPSVHHSSGSSLVAKPASLALIEEGASRQRSHGGPGAGGGAFGAFGAIGGTTLAPGGGGSGPPSGGVDGSAEGGNGGAGGAGGGNDGSGHGGNGAGEHGGAHVAPAVVGANASAKQSHVPAARRQEHSAQQLEAHEQAALRREETAQTQQQRQLEREQRQGSREETLPVQGETGGSTEPGSGGEPAPTRTHHTEAERLQNAREHKQARREREELSRSQHRQHKAETRQRAADKVKRENEHKHATAKRTAGREKTKKQAESQKRREEARRERERNQHRGSRTGKGVEAETETQ